MCCYNSARVIICNVDYNIIMRQKLTAKQTIIITLATLGVIAMGFVYVFIGNNIMQRVPKTEVAQANSADTQPLLSAPQPNPPAPAELAPQPPPIQPVQAPAPDSVAPAATPPNTDDKPKNGTSIEKRFRKLVSLLPGPRN